MAIIVKALAKQDAPNARIIRGIKAYERVPWTPAIPPTPQPGVPLVGQIFPLAEGLYAPTSCPETGGETGGGGGGGGGGDTYRDMILADSPRSFWRFGELAGAITAVDELGVNPALYALDLPGSYPVLGVAGLLLGDLDTCAYFTDRGYASAGLGTALQLQRFTLEALIKVPASPGAAFICQYDATDSAAWGRGFSFFLEATGKLRLQIGDGLGVWLGITGATVLLANTVYHVAGTWDGFTLRVFINGVENGSLNFPGGKTVSYTNATGFFIGKSPAGATPDAYSNAYIDELAVYPAALDAAAILRHKVKARG